MEIGQGPSVALLQGRFVATFSSISDNTTTFILNHFNDITSRHPRPVGVHIAAFRKGLPSLSIDLGQESALDMPSSSHDLDVSICIP